MPNRQDRVAKVISQGPMGLGDLLRFRCPVPGLGFQREFALYYYNGQKLVLVSKTKMSSLWGTMFSLLRVLGGTASETEALFGGS
jgi:hypothetical protein